MVHMFPAEPRARVQELQSGSPAGADHVLRKHPSAGHGGDEVLHHTTWGVDGSIGLITTTKKTSFFPTSLCGVFVFAR